MPDLRSRTSTHGRNMAGARSLWRATGMTDTDFGKPIIAIANSFTQFVPGHVHLRDVGTIVADAVAEAGAVAREFNTIAIDDGIAMGHSGMLYSLPSRELIADAVEYVVNAHCADALVCISNCDKITPGMLLAALRLNIPTIFVSGGPMEAGKAVISGGIARTGLDLVSAIAGSADESIDDEALHQIESNACPTCGSCSGMFTANSMNCLTEALGLALPGNGSLLATSSARRALFEEAGHSIVDLARRWYEKDDESALPRVIAERRAFMNAMAMDIAMGGSTNTVLHLLAAAREGEIDFDLDDIDQLSRRVPSLCKLAPSGSHHLEDFHRAGGVHTVLGELRRAGLLDTSTPTVQGVTLSQSIDSWDLRSPHCTEQARALYRAAPGGVRTTQPFQSTNQWDTLDEDAETGCIRSTEHAYRRDGGVAVLKGNLAPQGAIVKTAGVPDHQLTFTGPARVFESEDEAVAGILNKEVGAGDVVVIRYEGPAGGPGMQEMLHPTSFLKGRKLSDQCALITDGRFSGATSGLSVGHLSPEAASGGSIGLVEDGDLITIDIPQRSIRLEINDDELLARRNAMDSAAAPWTPRNRNRAVSVALQAYAALASSADAGAVRDISKLNRR